MMHGFLVFLGGMMVGCALGMLLMAMAAVSSDDDKRREDGE